MHPIGCMIVFVYVKLYFLQKHPQTPQRREKTAKLPRVSKMHYEEGIRHIC